MVACSNVPLMQPQLRPRVCMCDSSLFLQILIFRLSHNLAYSSSFLPFQPHAVPIFPLCFKTCLSLLFKLPNPNPPFLFTEDIKSVAVYSPVTFAFHPYLGPIHSVSCSPHHRNLFLTAGADTIRVYNMLQVNNIESFYILRFSQSQLPYTRYLTVTIVYPSKFSRWNIVEKYKGDGRWSFSWQFFFLASVNKERMQDCLSWKLNYFLANAFTDNRTFMWIFIFSSLVSHKTCRVCSHLWEWENPVIWSQGEMAIFYCPAELIWPRNWKLCIGTHPKICRNF